MFLYWDEIKGIFQNGNNEFEGLENAVGVSTINKHNPTNNLLLINFIIAILKNSFYFIPL